ncbi:MAG: DUF4834 family protein [Tannerellaceae bacterium]|jgi:hypothetical protein|nr:DUF4834 family protein [Tannerellaceae bacterium]
MLKLIFFIFFFIILLGFLAGFSIIRSIRNLLFGPPSNARHTKQQTTNNRQSRRQTSSKKKLFKDDEGEYIDYEEVK